MIIYKTTNLINTKIYIGKDRKNNPKYLGSGLYLKSAIKKYGKENFTKEVLEICHSIKELNEREIHWISYYNSNNKNIGYNLTNGGDGGDTYTLNPNKEEIREKLRLKSTGKKHSPETKENISKLRSGTGNGQFGKTPWNKGKPTPDGTREKIRSANKGLGSGRKLSETTKKKISAIHKNKSKSEEHKSKISKKLTGRKIKKEVVEKTASKLRGRKQKLIQCPYCLREGGVTMYRWHFENCKEKTKDLL